MNEALRFIADDAGVDLEEMLEETAETAREIETGTRQ
jgi:hypothetical protein